MRVAVIIPAAGRGRRIKSNIKKPYIKINGRSILTHTLKRFLYNKDITEIVIAVDKDDVFRVRRDIKKDLARKGVKIVAGGRERKDSVCNALRHISEEIDYVLIHDSVRPFITDRLIKDCLDAARRFKACITAVPVKPTLKCIGRDRKVKYTVDRKDVWEVQTPQAFKRDLIEKAYKKKVPASVNITDDSMLVELMGVRPRVVLGS